MTTEHRHRVIGERVFPLDDHVHKLTPDGTTQVNGHSHPPDDYAGPIPGSAASLTGEAADQHLGDR